MLFRTRYVPKMNGWNSIGLQYNICGKMHLFFKTALWKTETVNPLLWKFLVSSDPLVIHEGSSFLLL